MGELEKSPLVIVKRLNFLSKTWPVGEAFLRAIWAIHRPPCNFYTGGDPFAGRGGAVSGPQRRRYMFL
jgi:hypothetical protein